MQALLSLGARPHLPAALRPELVERAGRVADWDAALLAAEWHGLGPLLYRHLRDAGARLPDRVHAQLQGLYLRHRGANGVRLRALAEIVSTFDALGIDVRVLKGAALMTLVYPDPALRPISDLDLLVAPAQLAPASDALRRLGFLAPAAHDAALLVRHHHLPAAARTIDGVPVQVELHHNALSNDDRTTLRLDRSREAPQPFDASGQTALALGRHDMLWHLCEHLVGALPVPLRLVGLADVIGYAERFCRDLDWEQIARQRPLVLSVLAFADGVTPLPADVRRHLPERLLADPARAADIAQAWSWSPDGGVRAGGRWTQLRRTLLAPDWWLQLRYRDGGRRAGARARLRHLRVFTRGLRRRLPMEVP